MVDTVQVSEPPSLPPSAVPFQWALFEPLLLVLVFAAGEAVGAYLKGNKGSVDTKKAAEIEAASKQIAGTAATALRAAEVIVPSLRRTTLDNTIREILRAYADSEPKFKSELDSLHISVDEVADFVSESSPSLVGAAISATPTQARNSLIQVAKEAVAAKSSDTFDFESKAFQESKERVEKLLLELTKNARTNQ